MCAHTTSQTHTAFHTHCLSAFFVRLKVSSSSNTYNLCRGQFLLCVRQHAHAMPRSANGSAPSSKGTLKVSSRLKGSQAASGSGVGPCVKQFFKVAKARPDRHTLSSSCTLSAATGFTMTTDSGAAGLLSFTHGASAVGAQQQGSAAVRHFAEDDDDYLDDADSHRWSRSDAPKAAQPAAAAALCLPASSQATKLQQPTAVPQHTAAEPVVNSGAASDAASMGRLMQQGLRDSR